MNIEDISNAFLESDDDDDQDAVDSLAALDELANFSPGKAKRRREYNREDYLYTEKYVFYVSVPMCPDGRSAAGGQSTSLDHSSFCAPTTQHGTPSIIIPIIQISSEALMSMIRRRTGSSASGSVYPSGTSTNWSLKFAPRAGSP